MKPGAEPVLDGWDSVAYAPLVFRRTDAKRAGRGFSCCGLECWQGRQGQRQGQIQGSFASLQDDGVKRATAEGEATAKARATAEADSRGE